VAIWGIFEEFENTAQAKKKIVGAEMLPYFDTTNAQIDLVRLSAAR